MWFATGYQGYVLQRRPHGWAYKMNRVWHNVCDKGLTTEQAKKALADKITAKKAPSTFDLASKVLINLNKWIEENPRSFSN